MAAARGRPPGKPPTDWDAAERFYVQGEVRPDGGREFPTYGGVAVRFGVGVGAVTMHGGESGWAEKREAFRQKLAVEIEKLCIANGAQAAARAASLGADLAAKVARLAHYMLGDDPPPGRDAKWTGPSLDVIDRVGKLAKAYKDIATGSRYLAGGAPAAGPPPGGEEPGDLPPMSEDDRVAMLRALHNNNQDPGGPDGAETAADGTE